MALGAKTGGRQKGTPNKVTAVLKDAILQSAESAHPEGMAAYLQLQANKNPAAFLTLLGKVLPLTVGGDPENPVHITMPMVIGLVGRTDPHET